MKESRANDLVVPYGFILLMLMIYYLIVHETPNGVNDQKETENNHYQAIIVDGNKMMLLNTDSCIVHHDKIEIHTGIQFQEYPYEKLIIGKFNDLEIDSIFAELRQQIRIKMAQ